MKRSLEARFWSKVVKRADGCWLWVGSRSPKGYGRIYNGGRARWAHRIAWMLAHGEEPSSTLQVCHRCDVPACVRVDHLFLGTNRDNRVDCVSKGRANPARGDANGSRKHPERLVRGDSHWTRTRPQDVRGRKGTAHPMAKLNERQVREIRARVSQGDKQAALAAQYGVSCATIGLIKQGRVWAHLWKDVSNG